MSRIFLTAVLSAYFSCVVSAKDPLSFSGTATNTTNPNKPSSGAVVVSFNEQGECVLRVEAPLYGSGPCNVKQFDQATNALTILSTGPSAQITWSGTLTDTGYAGSYSIVYPNFPQLPEQGAFALTVDAKPANLSSSDVLSMAEFKSGDKTYHLLSERNLVYVLDQDYSYVGIRLFLDEKQTPIIRIEDHKDGSQYIDPKNNKTLMEWHTDGKDGYFSKTEDSVTNYYDRFMNSLHWSSVVANGQRIYANENDDSIELFDAAFKTLNIRSGKTSAGKLYWAKTYEDGLIEYFDDSMNSLNWFSAVRDGQTYYARVTGKKVRVYDANFKEVRRKPHFWSNVGRGLAAGLAAYGQALQTQANAANQSLTYSGAAPSYNSNTQTIGGFEYTSTTGSDGTYYNTTTQRIGNFDYSNTTGSSGYSASTTNQRIGNFSYLSGSSSNGSISGTAQQIGNFNYMNYTTPAGQWNGSSQQIGNFTYHSFTAPDGSVHSGTTQRIGDFLYTTIN